MEAFRFIFELTKEESKNNFLPVLIQNPKRQLKAEAKCSGYALSCFDTEKNAEARYQKLMKNNRNIYKTIGTHLGKIYICETDGVVSEPNNDGPFDLHIYQETDFNSENKLEILGCLLNTQ
ncbi:MAG: hypothetical protein HC908_16645 [Calothrix sp. SM1_7_51]|nr:hypothetical protein [Calothrix sp. SM1_7_51]